MHQSIAHSALFSLQGSLKTSPYLNAVDMSMLSAHVLSVIHDELNFLASNFHLRTGIDSDMLPTYIGIATQVSKNT